MRIVRDHDDGLAMLFVQRLQQVKDFIARLAIEVTRGLVAQQERGIRDDGACNAYALLLATREFARLVLDAIAEAHECERRVHALESIRLSQLREEKRQLHVALRREHRQQVVHLEHEADIVGAPAAQCAVRQPVDGQAFDLDAALGRPVQASTTQGPRIRVPTVAIQRDGGETFVWVVNDGRVERRAVTIGPESEGNTEVLAGVTSGEELVSPVVPGLEDGGKVKLAEGNS